MSVKTNLLFRFNNQWHKQVQSNKIIITAHGSKSGSHTGRIFWGGDQRTLIFKPDKPFAYYETVQINISLSVRGRRKPLKYEFQTSPENPSVDNFSKSAHQVYETMESKTAPVYGTKTVINGVSVPADFPRVDVAINQNTAPGKLFLNNWGGSPYIMILENDGTPYFYQRVPERSRDFKVQPSGTLTRRVIEDIYAFVEMDSNYKIIDTLACVSGYGTDEHEVQVLPDGRYFLIGLDYQPIDMSQIVPGGNPAATVVGNHVQELDKDDNLLFEWRSWDHFEITDAVHEDLLGGFIDYVHMNSIAIDYDGHILISSRHLSEVTKINRNTGDIIWRLGGVNNQFTLVNDEDGISYQHDMRPVPGQPDHYTIFDNGNFHDPPYSRVVEFAVDTAAMTATKVWEYRHTPDRYTWWMGNAQRLPNGNTLINWADGSLPKATEVTAAGEVVYEMNFTDYIHCYRTFRFDWESAVDVPYLIAESHSDHVSLIFNKFGDPTIKSYVIYGGQEGDPIAPIDTVSQTWLDLADLENDRWYYFRVTALDTTGKESGFSNQEAVLVNYNAPGENLLINGDFSDGSNHWDLVTSDDAVALGSIEDGWYHLAISDGGSYPWNVQLKQEEVELVNGREYIFSFDGYSDSVRVFDAKLERSGSPWENYGMIGATLLTTTSQNFSYQFVMTHPTDFSSRVVFNSGDSDADIFLNNVSVKEVVPVSIAEDSEKRDQAYHLYANYPNPFNNETVIRFAVPELSHVTIDVYNLLGQKVDRLTDVVFNAGTHQKNFSSVNLSSGIYFYQMEAMSILSTRKFSKTGKLIIIK